VDGEVPSPWKERIAAHVASCPGCAARVERYRRLSGLLSGAASVDESAVVSRIEARLGGRLDGRIDAPLAAGLAAAATGLAAAATGPSLEDADASRSDHPRFWGRNIPLPLPVAIAAAAIFLFFAGVAASTFIRPAKPDVQTLAASEIKPADSQAANMEALVHYLESQNAQVNLTIQLPSGTTFDSSGKPFVMKATDANYAPFSQTDTSSAGSEP
jgi:anti-sigma factor RsiW